MITGYFLSLSGNSRFCIYLNRLVKGNDWLHSVFVFQQLFKNVVKALGMLD